MRRFPIWTFALPVAIGLAVPAASQTGWSREVTDYGAYYSSERSDSKVLVLLLWEIDQKTGSNLLGMPDSASGTVIEKALAAAPFTVEQIVSEDVSNQRTPKLTGYANTPQGRKAFAATLTNRGTSRRLVVLLDDPANIDKLLRRVGSVSNFGSTIAAADRPGWVPGQRAASSGGSYDAGIGTGIGTKGTFTPAPQRAARSTTQQVPSQQATQRTARPRGNYALPNDQSDFYDWPRTGPVTYSPNIKDPLAPRGYIGSTGPKYNVSTHHGAYKNLIEYGSINATGTPTVQRLNPWSKFDGRDARLMMVPTARGGQKGVLIAYISSGKNSPTFGVLGYEVPEQTFLDGGGIIRMLLIRGVIPNAGVFSKEQQARIAKAPFKQQMEFYEAALEKLYQSESRKFVANQSAVTLRMMELNYDLLLGGDITSPYIGD